VVLTAVAMLKTRSFECSETGDPNLHVIIIYYNKYKHDSQLRAFRFSTKF